MKSKKRRRKNNMKTANTPKGRAKQIKCLIEDALFKYWEILLESPKVQVGGYTQWYYSHNGPGEAVNKIFSDIEKIED